jgi:hypothetical protein
MLSAVIGFFGGGVFMSIVDKQRMDELEAEVRKARNDKAYPPLAVEINENTVKPIRRTVYLYTSDGRTVQAPPHKLHDALKRAYYLEKEGRGFSLRELLPVLSRSEFEGFRDALMRHKFLEWAGDDPRVGTRWTGPGYALLRAAVEDKIDVTRLRV